MRRLRAFALFWWDFIVGDDWWIAAGVVLTLAAIAGLDHAGIQAWWVAPPAVVAVVWVSLRRAVNAG